MELVYVEWEDASGPDSLDSVWVDRTQAKPAPAVVFKQVGFVVEADDTALVLTEAYSDELMSRRTRIPRGMIRRLVKLNPDRKPRR